MSAVQLTASMVKSMSAEALNKMEPEQRTAALGLLPLSQALNSASVHSGVLDASKFKTTVFDFIVSTVDTPEERAHFKEQAELAMDKYLAPTLGGKDSSLYGEVKALSLTLFNNLMEKVGGKK